MANTSTVTQLTLVDTFTAGRFEPLPFEVVSTHGPAA
jgi:hypothetical protein